MPKAWPIVFWTKFVSSETIKIKSAFYYRTGRTELKFFLKNGVRLILSLIYAEKETQKGKMKNTKAQKCKRCENVKM